MVKGANGTLKKLIELDSYMRNYYLYKEYQDYQKYNNEIIEEAKEKFTDINPSSDDELNFITNFYTALDKVIDSNKALEENFNKYNFSRENVRNMKNDFKIAIYEFVKENMKDQITNKKFSSNDDFKQYLYLTSKALWQFYSENFYLLDDARQIFEKALSEMKNYKLTN